MISVTVSSAMRSSSGPRRSASLKISRSRRAASMPAGSLPFVRTCSTISWIFSVAFFSRPARSTPDTVSRFRSRRSMSSRWICSFTWRRIAAALTAAGSGRLLEVGAWCLVLGAWKSVLGAWCLVLGAWGSGMGTCGSVMGETRSMLSPIWMTESGSSSTMPSVGMPFTYVPFALCRSSIFALSPSSSSRACRSETSGNGSRMRQALPRPIR